LRKNMKKNMKKKDRVCFPKPSEENDSITILFEGHSFSKPRLDKNDGFC
jgi:hypothetical protein